MSHTLVPPFSVATARGRLFYLFLAKLKDLILPGFLHQKCIKLAQGLLVSVASILQSCHTSFLSACSFFLWCFVCLFVCSEDNLLAEEKFRLF